MRAELTRYLVEDWGEGELWTGDGLVLAHDFDFHPVSDTCPAAISGSADSSSADLASSRSRMAPSQATFECGEFGTDLAPLALDTNRRLTTRLDPGELVERLAAFLAGEVVVFDDVPLDLSSWTRFQEAVAAGLRRVPRGEVVTYGELAALAGYPGAQRAVGTFCARNHFMVLVPCHRVVAPDGIGSYGSSGVAVKRRLLALEGVAL